MKLNDLPCRRVFERDEVLERAFHGCEARGRSTVGAIRRGHC
jgi:hypothetical protein